MPQEFKTIELILQFGIIKLGTVNCYLIKNGIDYILIDTGPSNRRNELERELENAGCKPGNLKFILLTHGDFDHTGNARYLREKFGAKITMHQDDRGITEQGNMFWNRKSNFFFKIIAPIIFGFGNSERFKPDFSINEGDNFSEYGFDAKVIYLPGHSKGSIGILTSDGNLFCGDLLTNIAKPTLNSIMDDIDAANVSIEKIKNLNINVIYPGHGKPFPIAMFVKRDVYMP